MAKAPPADAPIIINLNVYGRKVEVDIDAWSAALIIDPNDISKQLAVQAQRYFDISMYAAVAVTAAERCKQRLDIWSSETWSELFTNAAGRGDKPPTVDAAKALVKSNPEFKRLSDLYIDATEDAALLEGVRDAMKQKQFMLGKLAEAQKAEGA